MVLGELERLGQDFFGFSRSGEIFKYDNKTGMKEHMQPKYEDIPPGFSISFNLNKPKPKNAHGLLTEDLQRLIINTNPDRRIWVVLSRMRATFLVVDGYVVSKDSPWINKMGVLCVKWRCRTPMCPYTCPTFDGKITGEENSHNHNKDPYESDSKNQFTDFIASDTQELKNSLGSEDNLKKIKQRLEERGKLNYKKCDTCMYRTKTEVGLMIHKHKIHNVEFRCEKCERIAQNLTNLRNHIMTKHDKVRFQCDTCRISYTSKSHLKNHMMAKHEGVTQFCDLCNYKTLSKRSLKNHNIKHVGKKFFCDICSFQFTLKFNLLTHIKIKHEGFKYSCDYCNYKVTQKRVLTMHHQKHHSDEKPLDYVEKDLDRVEREDPENCMSSQINIDSLEKNKYQDYSLRKIENKHENNIAKLTPENDGLCLDEGLISGKKEVQNSEEKANYDSTQNKPKKYKHSSDQCEFQCWEMSLMIDHKDKHHKHDIFTCTQCDYWAHSQSHLQDHTYLEHSDKSLNCDQCGYNAQCKSDLENHSIFTHKQELDVNDQLTEALEKDFIVSITDESQSKNKVIALNASNHSETNQRATKVMPNEANEIKRFIERPKIKGHTNDVMPSRNDDQNANTTKEQIIENMVTNSRTGEFMASHDEKDRDTEAAALNTNTMKYIEALHVQSKHEGQPKGCLKCECEKAFLDTMSKHRQSGKAKYDSLDFVNTKVKEDKTYKCTVCSYSSFKKGNLWVHEKASHAGLILNCDQCEFMSPSLKLMRGHRLRVHGPTGMEYSCENCTYQSISQANLAEHVQVKHEGKRYQCSLCDYKSLFKKLLTKHIQLKHENLTIKCTKCEFQAYGKASMEYHTNLTHTGVRYSCELCEYKAIMKRGLKRHMQDNHNPEYQKKVYSCDHCSSSFFQKSNIKNHEMTIHKGILHKCVICNYESVSKGAVRQHKRNVHEGIKYFCDQCDFQFTKYANLSAHIKIKHEGFRYSCELCDYKVTQKRVLDKHKLKVHS